MTVAARRGRPVEFPAGTDAHALLAPLRHSAWLLRGRHGAAYRRAITESSPLLFSITYLGHHLRVQDTGEMSFSRFHLDLATRGQEWMYRRPQRHIEIAPRGAAKTTWLYLILPLWAVAHGHRRFFLAFSYNRDLAVGHLANLRMELDANDLLRDDFPELAPKRIRGARNTAQMVVANDATFAARGLGEASLGIRVGEVRPDLVCGDDMEPVAADYSADAKAKLESRFIDGILPMGSRDAVVALTGTVTMSGSLIHDAVRHAAGERDEANRWVRANRFDVHHYRPIQPDGKSVWPQRWSVAELAAMRAADPRGYALNMENDPVGVRTGTYWTPASIHCDSRMTVVRRVLSIDVATTSKRTSDFTTLTVLGTDVAGRRAVIEHAEQGRMTGLQIRERIHELVGLHPKTLRSGCIEVNQGGDTWIGPPNGVLLPLPLGFTLTPYNARGHKSDRIERLYARHTSGAVVHGGPLRDLRAQMLAYPDVANDDLLDGAAAGVEFILTGDPMGR